MWLNTDTNEDKESPRKGARKFVEQVGRLEIQGRVDVVILSVKSEGWKLKQEWTL